MWVCKVLLSCSWYLVYLEIRYLVQVPVPIFLILFEQFCKLKQYNKEYKHNTINIYHEYLYGYLSI